MDQIRAIGCVPVPQVGVAGYFIDIGVRHPEWPYGFILGVECDGASYHSAKSARDRDRLRQEVLERLGWNFHRVWSTDWFNNPRREGERLREAISKRMIELRAREMEFSTQSKFEETAKDIRLPNPTQAEFALFPRPERSFSGQNAPNNGVAVGDTVRVRYLSDGRNVVVITISATKSDPSRGIVHQESPIAKALLGANEGDEVEVLSGSYVRPAIVEAIDKNKAEAANRRVAEDSIDESYI
jgi:very-short-patch-repair endonuclease